MIPKICSSAVHEIIITYLLSVTLLLICLPIFFLSLVTHLSLTFSRFEYQLNTWWQLRSDLPCFQSSIWLWTKCVNSAYDALQDKPYISVPKKSQFQSGPRVVKIVLNTQCYLYLWLTMWFHAKKSKETLKNSKSLILQCKFGSRAQKWPKIAKKKMDHSIAIYSFFWKLG